MNNENTKRCRLQSTLELPPLLTSQGTRLSTSTADDLQRRFILWPYKTNIFERKDVLPVPFLFSYLSAGHLWLRLPNTNNGPQVQTFWEKNKHSSATEKQLSCRHRDGNVVCYHHHHHHVECWQVLASRLTRGLSGLLPANVEHKYISWTLSASSTSSASSI